MACTCQSALSALRQPTRRVARPAVALFSRSLSSSSSRLAGPTLNSKTASPSTAPVPPTSSCPAGTSLKGLNYLKDGQDPVALEDSEYPSWVWTLLDPATKEHGQNDEAANLRKQRADLKRRGKTAIKAANDLKG